MTDKFANQKKDPDLQSYAVNFLKAFKDAAAVSEKDLPRIISTGRVMIFQGGAVEFTEQVTNNLNLLALRAAILLGSKAGNEKALRQIALKVAQDFLVKNNAAAEAAAKVLIEKLFEQGNAKFDFLVPNHLIRLEEGVRSIWVGRVRAMLTDDFDAELAETSDSKVRIVTDQGFSIEFAAPVLTIRMYPVCWVVSVNSAKENVEEEAKWLIDIAVGFLRLHYNVQCRAPRFPQLGAIEPHPLRPKEAQKVGAIISDAEVFAGGSSLPPVYEVGKAIETITLVF